MSKNTVFVLLSSLRYEKGVNSSESTGKYRNKCVVGYIHIIFIGLVMFTFFQNVLNIC